MPTTLAITTADQVVLGATLYEPAAPVGVRGSVIMASATGVLQSYYAAFCSALAERGFRVLSFDWRGLGLSRPAGSLRGNPARLQDWGQLDLEAAIAHVRGRWPDQPVALVGHSAGAQLVGLAPSSIHLRAIVQVAGSSGYFGGLHPNLRRRGKLMLGTLAPMMCAVLGYAPMQRFGWGADLPKQVALQWGQWCSRPGYVMNALGRTVHGDVYDRLRVPLLNITPDDDEIATVENRHDLLRLFGGCTVTFETLATLPGRPVGHIRILHGSNSALWASMFAFLDTHVVAAAA